MTQIEQMYFSFKIFMAMVEACLLIVERCFECKLLVEYYSGGDYVWMGLTLAFLWLPGLRSAIRFWLEGCDPEVKKQGLRIIHSHDECTHQWRNIKIFLFQGMLVPISSVIR